MYHSFLLGLLIATSRHALATQECMNPMSGDQDGECNSEVPQDEDMSTLQLAHGRKQASGKVREDKLLVDMAEVARAVWHFDSLVNGWTLKKELQQDFIFGDKDNVGIYEKDGKCAVSFAATNSAADFFKNLNIGTSWACGFWGVHKGFYGALVKFTMDPKWKSEFEPYLKSSACSGGIYVTGHSLGGALATIFSACANSGQNPYGFRINGLYSFGAPAVSKQQLTNGQSSDGCFPGGRYWNKQGTVDPVPQASSCFGFVHERIKTVKLTSDWSCAEVSCNSTGLEWKPSCFLPVLLHALTNLKTHEFWTYYLPKVEKCYR